MPANPSTTNAHNRLISELIANLPPGFNVGSNSNVKLPNRAFDTPNNSKWLRATVIVQDSNNVQAGGFWKRYDGIFVIDSFYPVGTNDLEQLAEAEVIAAIFEDVELDGVKCQDVLIDINNTDSAWYNVQITVDFFFEGKKNE